MPADAVPQICDVIVYGLGGVLVELGPNPPARRATAARAQGDLQRRLTSVTAPE